ncbi:titin homolog [Palaemon carinicauda]|uniref:titin homolog n=1 Tax=Palaemon carinicauda TaxID=392227 RepID=UPI0035B65CF9
MADYLYYTSKGDDPSLAFSMDDLLSCSVCCEPYHEKTRQPVLLPRCGHTFCRPCTSFLVQKGNIVCPSCRVDQKVEGADNLPTEFSLLAISLAQQVHKQDTCQEHGVKLSFWCKTCNVPACGECLFEDHPMTSHCVIKSTAYVNEMKESVTDITNKFMEALDGREKRFFERIFTSTKVINDALRTITVLRKDMEEARELMKGVKIVEGIGPTQTLSESAKFLGLKWNLQDVNLNLGPVMIKNEATAKSIAEEPESTEPEPEPIKEDEKVETATNNNDEVACDNGINEKEKADDEKEKDSEEEEEEEFLTEEEIRKRKKIQRLKERLAAATVAAEQAKQESKEKVGTKKDKVDSNNEKKAEDEVTKTPTSSRESYESTLKNLKPWQRRVKPWEPTPREPSITPDRETDSKAKKESDKKEETEKGTDDTVKDEKSKDEMENNQSKDNKKDESDITNDNKKSDQSNENATNEMTAGSNMDTNEPAATPVKGDTKTDSTDANMALTTEGDSKKEDKVEKKTSSSTIKKPRGRLARNALKRAQTMDLSKKLENPEEDTNKDTESENIKGLDLETHKSKPNEEVQQKHKEAETQTCEEINPEENEGARDSTAATQSSDGMLEMEPDEKERIATELLQVPSLTVCIEGIGGLLARVAWEFMGLHIYCHQFQELPYDIIVKSNVLHAVIPTKDPMVFLDIGTDDQTLGRVYIKLWGHLRRSNNMLLLCLGDRGRSLKNSRLFRVLNADGPGERVQGGDYEYNDGRGGEALIDDLEYQGKYAMPMEMGLITSATGGNRAMDSQFYICTEEDLNRQFACPFGRVIVGLPILKEAVWISVTTQVYIQDCGVVLDWPRI